MPIRFLLAVLVCEGASDEWFLPVLLRRAIQRLCDGGRVEVQVEVEVAAADHQRPDTIIDALDELPRFDVVLYHHDGAPAASAQAKVEEVRRDVTAVRREPFVAVVPVRETEAWLLADVATLARAVGVPSAVVIEATAARAKDVEGVADPKKALNSLAATAAGRRRSGSRLQAERPDLYAAVAADLDLDRLRQVPSFERWWDEMAQALEKMGYQK
ncbi:DUF4276 family protein [Catenulispora rubra]|uniref:DUF4276 family protein n=1 Tax=Catenulispora rubra TaxID=280293 RepID=UPI0018921AA5|nr:DUF4276 family protein [Catenulispora rubra]